MKKDFRDLELLVHYNTDTNNISKEFYNPVLSKSIVYKRAVAYFNSKSLIEITYGIENLVSNNGKIYMLISPTLEKNDYEAIKLGYSTREKLIESKIIKDLENINLKEKDRYNILAWLIYKEILDIKIVYRNDSLGGIFHSKLGLLYDIHDNIICFHGSNNETYSALESNYESFDVDISWVGGRDLDRIRKKESQFDKLWNNNNNIWKTDYISEKILEKIELYRIANNDPFKINIIDFDEKSNKIGIPEIITIRDYQKDAINSWFDSNCNGIFEMATGTGKTITALSAISILLNEYIEKKIPIGLIIVLPYNVLLEQWKEDLNLFNIDSIECNESYKKWLLDSEEIIKLTKLGYNDYFCLITTNNTFKSQKFQGLLKDINMDYILCIDEMHNFISTNSLKALPKSCKYRLGLSATLESEYKEEELSQLISYFGEGIIYRFSLEKAINEGYLTKYNYYPIFVELTEFEKDEYFKLTKKIARASFIKDTDSENNESLKILLNKRARIIASAENKLLKLKEMKKIILTNENMIFYCGDKIEDNERFIDKVNHILAYEIGIRTHTFTSRESKSERTDILNRFKTGDLDALTAIRCLDEGLDIPNLKSAFILSSSSNPKEFIQRRGRVLRKSKDKEFANIFDFFVVPTLDEEEIKVMDEATLESEKNIIKKELKRFQEFANISMNPHESYKKITKIMNMYR